MTGRDGEIVEIDRAELARLRGIEEAARWHYANSACAGWPQGEVLALALNVDPDGPRERFADLLDALHIPHDEHPDPLAALLRDGPEGPHSGRHSDA